MRLRLPPRRSDRQPYSSDLTDAEWAQIAPLLHARDPTRGGRPGYDRRLVLDTISYVLRAGCAWRLVPHDLAPWWVAYRWFRVLARDGTWDRVHDRPRDRVRAADGRDPEPTAAVIDARSVRPARAGPSAAGTPTERVAGRKRHLLVDTSGLVLVVRVHAASVQDRAGGRRVLAAGRRAFAGLGKVWADGGYANAIDRRMVDWSTGRLGPGRPGPGRRGGRAHPGAARVRVVAAAVGGGAHVRVVGEVATVG